MKFHYLIVEGQTEQAFAETTLRPLAEARGVFIQVVVPKTGIRSSGSTARGGGSWKHTSRMAEELLRIRSADKVGLLFDVYGSELMRDEEKLTGRELWQAVRDKARDKINHPDALTERLSVGPVLYEFETLVIAALASGTTRERAAVSRAAREAIAHAGGAAELVNGSVNTSPSHRVSEWWDRILGTRYEKVVDGPRILAAVPWHEIEQACPTFAAWVDEFLR